ncbi:uncharacterized protein V1518DRAFT_430136 [Limtongia smithiae]|uniref:uncharacterized protein n=1 Tax=Limtongia smithiae TaxID=1125753 RepID=UPI0034CFF962
MAEQDAYEYAGDFKTNKQPRWLPALYIHWLKLFPEPFKWIVVPGLFELEDEQVQIEKIVLTAFQMLDLLDIKKTEKMFMPHRLT